MIFVGRNPSYSAGSLHISSRALDINQLHYKDLNNKPLAYKINNDGYIKDPQGGWRPNVESSELFNSFRRNLYGDGSGVKELYDPWEMVKNGNERLNSPKVLEKTDLSYLHRNHLHLSLTRR